MRTDAVRVVQMPPIGALERFQVSCRPLVFVGDEPENIACPQIRVVCRDRTQLFRSLAVTQRRIHFVAHFVPHFGDELYVPSAPVPN
jgi:hypothetical protein